LGQVTYSSTGIRKTDGKGEELQMDPRSSRLDIFLSLAWRRSIPLLSSCPSHHFFFIAAILLFPVYLGCSFQAHTSWPTPQRLHAFLGVVTSRQGFTSLQTRSQFWACCWLDAWRPFSQPYVWSGSA
jgi:hypothetical protein